MLKLTIAFLKWLLELLAHLILRLEDKETVRFSLLCRHRDREVIVNLLEGMGVTAIANKHSDYLRCETSYKNFENLFGPVVWRSMLVGSWELADSGTIPDSLEKDIKAVLLRKNLMLPPKFIKNTTIQITEH